MILRPKSGAPSKSQILEPGESPATGPRAPSGTQGWETTGSPQGSTTLWRRRGRLARLAPRQRRDQ